MMACGEKANYGYLSWFMVGSITEHSDFLSTSINMNIITSETENILNDFQISISTGSTISVTPISNNILSVSFIIIQNYNSDISYQIIDESIIISEDNWMQFSPDLPWSISGSSLMTYNISSYKGMSPPSWVLINSNTGVFNISSPVVSADSYYFS